LVADSLYDRESGWWLLDPQSTVKFSFGQGDYCGDGKFEYLEHLFRELLMYCCKFTTTHANRKTVVETLDIVPYNGIS
jgi:hypothetical protein